MWEPVNKIIKNRNVRFFMASLICWTLLVYFFEGKTVWGVLVIAGILYFVNILVKLHMHSKINKNYNVGYGVTLQDMVLSSCYVAPLFIVFLVSYYLTDSTEIHLPPASEVCITFIVSVWISWFESVVLTNSFMIQIIDSLHKEA